jgi:hypothetical protein
METVERVPKYDEAKAGHKWLAYFDLLAWSKFCEKADLSTIFHVYSHLLEQLNNRVAGWHQITRAWASDTFLFYSRDDSPESFQVVDLAARWFIALMLKNEIPIRGALAQGDFYADEDSRLFFGRAFVEAHDFAEKQQWIGLVLTPSAETKAAGIFSPSLYRRWPVLFKGAPEPVVLQVFMLNRLPLSPKGGEIVRALQRMKARTPDKNNKTKYTRTIEFLRASRSRQ